MKRLAARAVPEHYDALAPGRDDALGVARYGHGVHLTGVTVEAPKLRAGLRVPEPHRPVGAAGHDETPVRRKGQRAHRPIMAAERRGHGDQDDSLSRADVLLQAERLHHVDERVLENLALDGAAAGQEGAEGTRQFGRLSQACAEIVGR